MQTKLLLDKSPGVLDAKALQRSIMEDLSWIEVPAERPADVNGQGLGAHPERIERVREAGHCYYLYMDTNSMRDYSKKLSRKIRDSGVSYDGIVGRGMSGVIFVPTLGMRLKKSTALVRKGERSHSSYKAEVAGDMETYIIVDDLIDSGETMREIMKAMKPAKCVGIFLYKYFSGETRPDGSKRWHGFPVYEV